VGAVPRPRGSQELLPVPSRLTTKHGLAHQPQSCSRPTAHCQGEDWLRDTTDRVPQPRPHAVSSCGGSEACRPPGKPKSCASAFLRDYLQVIYGEHTSSQIRIALRTLPSRQSQLCKARPLGSMHSCTLNPNSLSNSFPRRRVSF
jgi:hypothetical protein